MSELRYDPTAARKLIDDATWDALAEPLHAARQETLDDVALMTDGDIPADKQPLDAGFIPYPDQLLNSPELDPMLESAERLRSEIDRLVVLGIGGSYMGLRALFEGLSHPYHNELSRADRGGAPRLYFEGNNLDNDTISGLLELLELRCKDPEQLQQRWGIVVISKSGGTLETAAAFRIFRDALEAYYGADSKRSTNLVVPITGEEGKLRSLSEERGYPDVFSIPDGIGGRYSVFTPVGLYPAAVLGMDVRPVLQGAADMTERFRTAPIGENPVLDYVATCHLLERDRGMNIRVLSTWGNRLEAVGLWYDQLLSESLGKHGRGATPITGVNTRDLHSRGQQHQQGARDKVITNVIVDSPATDAVILPEAPASLDQDQLNRLAGREVPSLLDAAIQGTNKAYADDARPTADLHLPRLDAHTLGQLLQMLMLATVVEGRLIGINPYGQPGVEDYKRNMSEILFG
ncbi:MAG: glucose-6-phosphate isomerase [Planctomycetaceae bacterium]|nr:glucose-6-phosphate isomerase [Planctomycetaceae bacterium]